MRTKRKKSVHTAPRNQPAPKTTASSQAAAARAPKPAAPVSPKVTPMRKKAGALNMEVCVIKPASMEDTREIADTLLARESLISAVVHATA